MPEGERSSPGPAAPGGEVGQAFPPAPGAQTGMSAPPQTGRSAPSPARRAWKWGLALFLAVFLLVWILRLLWPGGEGEIERRRLIFAAPIWPVVVAVLFAAPVLLVLVRRLYAPEMEVAGRRPARVILLLRLLTVLFVLFALLGPLFELFRTSELKPRLFILVDRSLSMSLDERDAPESERAVLAAALGLAALQREEGAPRAEFAEIGRRLSQEIGSLARLRFLADRLAAEIASPDGPTLRRARREARGIEKELRSLADSLPTTVSRIEEATAREPQAHLVLDEAERLRRDLDRNLRFLGEPLEELDESDRARARDALEIFASRARRLAERLRRFQEALDECAGGRLAAALSSSAELKSAAKTAGEMKRVEVARLLLAGVPAGAERSRREGLVRRLEQDFRLQGYEFSSGPARERRPNGLAAALETATPATPAAPSPSTDPTATVPLEPVTDLGTPLTALLGSAGAREGRIAGVIVFSDFRSNAGPDPIAAARALGANGSAVFPVVLGRRTPPTDAILEGVEAPRSAMLGSAVRVTVAVRALRLAGRTARISIRRDEGGERPLVEKTVRLGPGVTCVRLSFTPEDDGARSYTAVLAPIEGETSVENNERRFHLTVVDTRVQGLLVGGPPRWEYRFLRGIFERDRRVQLRAVVFEAPGASGLRRGRAPGEYPASREELFFYDFIVLGDVDPRRFERGEIEDLKAFVSEKGGTLVLIAGAQYLPYAYRDTPLEELLPVILDPRDPDPVKLRHRFADGLRFLPTPAGARTSLLALHADPRESAAIWKVLMPLRFAIPVRQPKPGATVLAEGTPLNKARGESQKIPLLVTQRYGMGQVLFVATDETWRWRYKVGERYHGRFWGQVVGWATGDEAAAGKEALGRARTDRNGYVEGETVTVEARVRKDDRTPLEGGRVVATLRLGGKDVARTALAPLPGRGGMYRGSWSGLQRGSYTVLVRAEELPEKRGEAAVSFLVERETPLELQELTCDLELARELAEVSGGRVYLPETVSRIPLEIPAAPERRRERVSVELASTWFFLLALLALLAAEWAVRKEKGLM